MRHNVRYLGRPRSLGEARSLFLAGRTGDALAGLGSDASDDAAILRARCLLRLGDPAAAAAALRRLPDGAGDPHARVERDVLLGAALLHSGKPHLARRFQDTAVDAASALGGAALAEALLYGALSSTAAGRLGDAEEFVTAGAAVRAVPGDAYSRALPLVRAQLLQARALLAESHERYAARAALLERAWAAQDVLDDAARDVWVRARVLAELAPLVSELHLERQAAILEHQLRRFPWPGESCAARWVVQRALGWHAALSGDQLRAFVRFRDAADDAPSAPAGLASALDRAYLATEMSQRVIAAEEMARAYRLADRIAWNAVGADDVNVLLALVEAYAREDAAVARVWLGRFRQRRTMSSSAALRASQQRRQLATEQDAEAAVLAAEGSSDAAIALRRRTAATWDDLGHSWRAARSAVALAELSGNEADIRTARSRVRPFGRSWLARRAKRLRTS